MLTSVLGLGSTVREPVKLSLGSPGLGGLLLVSRQLCYLDEISLGLPRYSPDTLTYLLLLLHLGLRVVTLGITGSGRVVGAGSSGVQTASPVGGSSTTGCSHSATDSRRLDVVESVLDQGDLALVSQLTGINVPDLGTQGVDEFEVVGYDTDGTCPVSDGDGQSSEGFSVQEIGRLVELQTGGSVSKLQ